MISVAHFESSSLLCWLKNRLQEKQTLDVMISPFGDHQACLVHC